jgi:hypothetical protein
MYKHPNLFAERNIQRFPNSKLLAAPAMSFKLTMGIRHPSMPPPCGTRLDFKVVV